MDDRPSWQRPDWIRTGVYGIVELDNVSEEEARKVFAEIKKVLGNRGNIGRPQTISCVEGEKPVLYVP